MNPQTGEVLAMVSLPTYDNNLFARGISTTAYQALANDPNKPLLNHAIEAQYPPGSTYKLVTGTGGLADGKITATDAGPDEGLPAPSGRRSSTTGTTAGFGPCDIYCGFGHSSDTFFFQVAGMLGIDRLGVLGEASTASAHRPGSTFPARSPASSRRTSGSRTRSAPPIFPGETYQAGIGQGYDVVTPIQLINAYAALANGGNALPAADRPRRSSVPTGRSSGRSSRS